MVVAAPCVDSSELSYPGVGMPLNRLRDTTNKSALDALERNLLLLEDGESDDKSLMEMASNAFSESLKVAQTIAKMKKMIETLNLEVEQLKASESQAQKNLKDLESKYCAMAQELTKKMCERIQQEKLEGALEAFEKLNEMAYSKSYIKKQIAIFKKKLGKPVDVDTDSDPSSEDRTVGKIPNSMMSTTCS